MQFSIALTPPHEHAASQADRATWQSMPTWAHTVHAGGDGPHACGPTPGVPQIACSSDTSVELKMPSVEATRGMRLFWLLCTPQILAAEPAPEACVGTDTRTFWK